MEELVEATRAAGWLRRVEGGGKLRTKSSHTYAEAASGEISWRSQPQAAPSAPESLAGCRVTPVVARKGLPHGLSLELADAGRGTRQLLLGAVDSDDCARWTRALEANATYAARLAEMTGGAAASEPEPEHERQRYAQLLQLTVDQALDPAVLREKFQERLMGNSGPSQGQADEHALKERHRELLAAKRYFEREHREMREARRSAAGAASWGTPDAAAASAEGPRQLTPPRASASSQHLLWRGQAQPSRSRRARSIRLGPPTSRSPPPPSRRRGPSRLTERASCSLRASGP